MPGGECERQRELESEREGESIRSRITLRHFHSLSRSLRLRLSLSLPLAHLLLLPGRLLSPARLPGLSLPAFGSGRKLNSWHITPCRWEREGKPAKEKAGWPGKIGGKSRGKALLIAVRVCCH